MENSAKMEFSERIRMNITTENLPSNFENEIVENHEIISIRCNLKSMDDINEWVKEFGNSTNTKWNFRKSCPSGKRFVCWKKFVCQYSSFNKVPSNNNKKGSKYCHPSHLPDILSCTIADITNYEENQPLEHQKNFEEFHCSCLLKGD
ncbi:uncharacterized protein LOC129989094 isoform X2 [Argiope bruennichi]|uniref:uncharacterized protein LOC129989094 isoform X2 n=1 Tax=Argiope bruennichi TaxID=94029 RepID=UPI0024953E7C|nr:uncharacterized protein LOC129989094 isoform X2 [Argiope bruennichi]